MCMWNICYHIMYCIVLFELIFKLCILKFLLSRDKLTLILLGKTSKKIKCIFYDIVLKGRGVKDQNQISEKIWNYDKGFKGGRWKNLMSQIHLSNILFIMCIKQQYSHINVKILDSFQVMTFLVHFLTLIWVFVITNNILKNKINQKFVLNSGRGVGQRSPTNCHK